MLHIDPDKLRQLASADAPWSILIQPTAKGFLNGNDAVTVFVSGDGESAVRAWIRQMFSAVQNEFGDGIKLTITEAFGTRIQMNLSLSQLARFCECMTLEQREQRRIDLLQTAIDELHEESK